MIITLYTGINKESSSTDEWHEFEIYENLRESITPNDYPKDCGVGTLSCSKVSQRTSPCDSIVFCAKRTYESDTLKFGQQIHYSDKSSLTCGWFSWLEAIDYMIDMIELFFGQKSIATRFRNGNFIASGHVLELFCFELQKCKPYLIKIQSGKRYPITYIDKYGGDLCEYGHVPELVTILLDLTKLFDNADSPIGKCVFSSN